MRVEAINIDTSIQHGRILYNWNKKTIFAVIIDCLFCLVFPVISICLFFGIIKRHTPDPFLDTFFLIMGLWLLLGRYLKGKLICIEGAGSGDDKKAVVEFLMQHFFGLENITGTEKVKSGLQTTFDGEVKEIIILLNEGNVYISRSTYKRYGSKPLKLNAPFDYISLLRFKRAFKNRSKI